MLAAGGGSTNTGAGAGGRIRKSSGMSLDTKSLLPRKTTVLGVHMRLRTGSAQQAWGTGAGA